MFGISCIYLLDMKGRVIITRHYRGCIPSDSFENFNNLLISLPGQNIPPILQHEKLFYLHRRHKNIYIVLVAEQ